MKLLSVNIGSPREMERRGRKVRTGIFKEPVSRAVDLKRLGLAGDTQVDRKIHGGFDKALLTYPSEHYEAWRIELNAPDLPFGAFGENLTTQGLMEDSVCIGDRFRIGTAEVRVTQPREPCSTLNARFGRKELAQRFKQTGRTGFYLCVVKEGRVTAGDPIERVHRDGRSLSIAEFNRVLFRQPGFEEILRRAREIKALPEAWKKNL